MIRRLRYLLRLWSACRQSPLLRLGTRWSDAQARETRGYLLSDTGQCAGALLRNAAVQRAVWAAQSAKGDPWAAGLAAGYLLCIGELEQLGKEAVSKDAAEPPPPPDVADAPKAKNDFSERYAP